MVRLITVASLLSLLFLGGECFAQGLLGKSHVSSQFLLYDTKPDAGFRFDNYSNGWQTQINTPVIWIENEEPLSGVAADFFATLRGVKIDSQSQLGDTNHANSIGGDFGFNVFFHATDRLRPFVTTGMIWNANETDAFVAARPDDPGTPENESKPEMRLTKQSAGATPFFGFGAEADLIDMVALRSSFVFHKGSSRESGVVNELFIRPSKSWFARLSLVIDTSGNRIGGIGGGLCW